MANRDAKFAPALATLALFVSAAVPTSAQECVPSQDPAESGQIEASFLAMGNSGGKPIMYLDWRDELYQLECPQCPALTFGDRLSVQYDHLFQCRQSHNGLAVSFTKIGTDPAAGALLFHSMEGTIVSTYSGGFKFDPIPKDDSVSEWTFDVPDPALMNSIQDGQRVRLRYFVSGCAGAVMFCIGVALGVDQVSPPEVQPPPPQPEPQPVTQPPPTAASPPVSTSQYVPPNTSAITVTAIGLFVLVIGIFVFFTTRPRRPQPAHPLDPPTLTPALVTTHEGDLILAKQSTDLQAWDETAITRQLESMRGESPAVVSHYIDSVKKRIVLNQNDKTALAQVKFLQTKVQELKLFKEGREIVIDLEAMVLEREKRLKTLQLENAQLDRQMVTHSQRDQLAALKEQRQMELEIAQIEKQIAELKAPAAPPAETKPTPEQQRANDKAASEARIQALKSEKQNALKLEDEQERILKVNAIDDALQREMERWAKLL